MHQQGLLTILVALLLAVTNSARSAPVEVDLLVNPSSFVVDGREHQSAKAAVEAALSKKPDILHLQACSAMKTQRVLDVMAELQGRFPGRVLMKTLEPKERGCPDFK